MAQTAVVPIDPASWVTHDDYPAEALRAKEQGIVALRMNIDATGALTACTIVQSSGSAALDATSCRVIRERGRFKAATDAKGQPVASTAERRIKWQLPTDSGAILSPYAMSIRLTLGDKGNILDCKTSGSALNGATFHACRQENGRYTGFSPGGFSKLSAGVLTLSTVLEVDGMPFMPDPSAGAVSDIPPYFIQTDSFTVDPTGKVVQCERRSSTKDKTESCPTDIVYEAKPDQPARRARMTTSTAFQPAS